MPDLKAQTITLHEGDKTALQYLGAAVVLQWSSLPEDVRKALLLQADAVGGLPLVSDLHEQIQALIHRLRTAGRAHPRGCARRTSCRAATGRKMKGAGDCRPLLH